MGVMSFFRKKKREAGVRISAPSDLSGYAETAGTPIAAMKIAAVFRAVQIISDTIARLQFEFKRWDTALRYYKPELSSPLYWFCTMRPSEDMSAFVFFKQLVSDVLLLGNAYVVPVFDDYGEVASLRLVSPYSVTFDLISRRYEVSDINAGVSGVFTSDRILHFKGPSLDGGYTGVSIITFAATTLGIAATADRETRDRFATGGKYKAIYHQETDSAMGWSAGQYSDDEMERSADEIEAKLNGGRAIIAMPGAGKLSPLSMTSADMQFLESRKFTVTEIARFFGVPRAKIMDDSSLNYKSAELVNADFYGDALAPIMTMIEQEFTAKLVRASVRWKYKFSFDLARLYSSDPMTRVNYEAKELSNGTKTVNELRRAAGVAPVEGGDEVRITANVVPLSQAGATDGEKNKEP